MILLPFCDWSISCFINKCIEYKYNVMKLICLIMIFWSREPLQSAGHALQLVLVNRQQLFEVIFWSRVSYTFYQVVSKCSNTFIRLINE